MTTSNKATQVKQKFAAHMTASRRDFIISYEEGLDIKLPKAVVENVQGVKNGFVDSMLNAEKALGEAFDSVASVCFEKGLTKLQAGKVIALVLEVKTISGAHEDKTIANRIKAKWHYVADKYYKVADESATVKDTKATKASDTSEPTESINGKPYTIEEMIANKKLGTLGALLGTRIKETTDRLTVIMGLLADATADDIEAITKALTDTTKIKNLEPINPPKPKVTRRKTSKA